MAEKEENSCASEFESNLPESESFPDIMVRLRVESEISIDDLANITRISPAFIQALEEGRLAQLPGKVFGRGFVKSICKAFELDPDPILAKYEEHWDQEHPGEVDANMPDVQRKSVGHVENAKKRPRRKSKQGTVRWPSLRALFPIGLALLLGGGGAVWWFTTHPSSLAVLKEALKGQKDTDKAAIPSPIEAEVRVSSETEVVPRPAESQTENSVDLADTEAESPLAAAEKPLAQQPDINAASEKVDANQQDPDEAKLRNFVEIIVKKEVRVRSDFDNHEPQIKTMAPGTYRFPFQNRGELLIYNAAAVDISFNDHPLGSLGGEGRVRRISFASAQRTAMSDR